MADLMANKGVDHNAPILSICLQNIDDELLRNACSQLVLKDTQLLDAGAC